MYNLRVRKKLENEEMNLYLPIYKLCQLEHVRSVERILGEKHFYDHLFLFICVFIPLAFPFSLFLTKFILENYSLSWVISKKRDPVHVRMREIRERRVGIMFPSDANFRESRERLKSHMEIFALSPLVWRDFPQNSAYSSQNLYKCNLFFSQASPICRVTLLSSNHIYWLLHLAAAAETPLPNKTMPMTFLGTSPLS